MVKLPMLMKPAYICALVVGAMHIKVAAAAAAIAAVATCYRQ